MVHVAVFVSGGTQNLRNRMKEKPRGVCEMNENTYRVFWPSREKSGRLRDLRDALYNTVVVFKKTFFFRSLVFPVFRARSLRVLCTLTSPHAYR